MELHPDPRLRLHDRARELRDRLMGAGSRQTPRRGVAVELQGVRRSYNGFDVLRGVDLSVKAGALLAIVGQSGTGKSVLLRQIIGLERPDAGRLVVGDLELPRYLALPPGEKPFRIAMVFQSAALLGSLTVAENVSLRLREQQRLPPAEIDEITRRVLGDVELEGTGEKLPSELSGGMRKRVAIARALAELIARIRATRGSTQMIVTHNLPLARAIADRIAVLDRGRIVECSTPAELVQSRQPLTREFLRAAALGT
ncbi:MAG: ATP-binding cassette domain-containing protein [Deltaproteobacteria bacterium]|nr:MAG: ATP-binding cassette domain-containing protein [Deltaproteobacteria bacterium]